MENDCRPAAVVEIGSTGIRLLIAELRDGGAWRITDSAGKSVALGRDVFTTGKVSRNSFAECLAVLRGFCELLAGWDIQATDVRCIATSALRAARNRDVFVDRVQQETGFNVTIVEGIEENRLMYMAVHFALKNDLVSFYTTNSMIIDVGGGSTEIMLLNNGTIAAAHSLKFGTISIDEQSRLAARSNDASGHYIVENLRDTQNLLNAEMNFSHIKTYIASGPELRLVSNLIGKEINDYCRSIDRASFLQFAENIQNYSPEECVQQFKVPYSEAGAFVPAIMINKFFTMRTAAEQLVIPLVSMREGMLIDIARGYNKKAQEEFYEQILASTVNLGRKYYFDEDHSRCVARLALTVFDELKNEHGMGGRERLLLEVAALLHDVGMFIAESGHQKHGCYIVSHSEIFGLLNSELQLIAQLVRCHCGSTPTQDDVEIAPFQHNDRMRILKMAALLRIADGMDRGHSQKIKSIGIEKKTGMLIIHAKNAERTNLGLERLGIESKGDLFQDVFGLKVILEND